MQRLNRIELLKYYKTNIDKEFKRYDWHTFSNLIALNLNRIVLKTMNDSEISSMYLNTKYAWDQFHFVLCPSTIGSRRGNQGMKRLTSD